MRLPLVVILAPLVLLPLLPTPTAAASAVVVCTPATGTPVTILHACVEIYAINDFCAQANTLVGDFAHCVQFVGPPL